MSHVAAWKYLLDLVGVETCVTSKEQISRFLIFSVNQPIICKFLTNFLYNF